MDIEEWEYLPDNGYLDFNDEGGKQIFLGKRNLEPKSAFDMDYFCSSPPRSPRTMMHNNHNHNQLVPLPILLQPRIGNSSSDSSAIVKKDIITNNVDSPNMVDHDTVSQVFFKTKENEFADMKLDTGSLKFEEKGEMITSPRMITSPKMKIEKKEVLGMECDDEEEEEEDRSWEEENEGGFNIWKWSLSGVGAICSFGVAAATICFLFFGSHQKRNNILHNNKIRFQIYAEDKNIKKVVQHATKFNEAVSVVAGVPISRAHITIGGYYDGL